MPKQTFFNLPENRHKSVLDSAIDEFAGNDYDKVSISTIVAKAGIAKGSFYQYFNDKEDVYCYLLDFVLKKQLEFVSQKYPPDDEKDFFTQAQNMVEAGVHFSFSYPKYSKIIYRSLFGNLTVHHLTVEYLNKEYLRHTRQLLVTGISMGAIRQDINIDLTAHLLSLIMSNFANIAIDKLELKPEGLISGDYVEDDRLKINGLISDTISLLRFGVGKTQI